MARGRAVFDRRGHTKRGVRATFLADDGTLVLLLFA
jgi:hypothetical protein